MKNIYNVLSVLRSDDIKTNDMLFIDCKNNYAAIIDNPNSDPDNRTMRDMKIPKERLNENEFPNDKIINRALAHFGLDIDGDSVLANTFINAMEYAKNQLKKERDEAIIPVIPNKEYQNIEYYGYFLGDYYITTYGSNYLMRILNAFKNYIMKKLLSIID